MADDDGLFPLDWPVDYSQCETCEPFDKDETGEVKAKFEDMAKWFLWGWTKRMFGTTESWLRPDPSCDREPTYQYLPPVVSWPLMCGWCRTCDCSCSNMTSLWISAPIQKVEEVMIGGEVLDPSKYRLSGKHQLIRRDGNSWPSTQTLGADLESETAWGIQAIVGTPVPTGGRIAAGILACELAKAACNDAACRLPKRVTSITRQGVAMTMLDDFEGLQKGRTGIWLIDSWVASINEVPTSASVISPDKWLAGRSNQPVTRRR